MKVSIIVPAHNEEENLPVLMKRLMPIAQKIGDSEILLVDDHSDDSTPRLCDEFEKKYMFVRALHRKTGERGMGFTLKYGTAAAKGQIIVWTMADLSDDPNVILKLVERIDSGADMVFGSRYMKGGTSGDLSPFKRFVSWGFTFASMLFVGIRVHDTTNAFRAFKKEVFEKVQPQYGDFGISPEFALKAHIAGYKLEEVPASYATRTKGVAQFKMLKMAIRYFGIFLAAIGWRIFGLRGGKTEA